MNARQEAFELLKRWEKGRQFADELLTNALGTTGLEANERALTTELFYGVLRQRMFLDWAIEQFALNPPRRDAQILLRLGVYQLLFLDRVPSYAAVSETTTLAKQQCSVQEARFVHAILRQLAEHKERVRDKISDLKAETPAIFYSHPQWLWERWKTRWGMAQAGALCEWDNTPPPVVLRVNKLKIQPKDFCILLSKEGIDFKPHPFSESCLIVSGVTPERAPGFDNGFFYVQDPSTLLAVETLDPQPDENILDACAAPGGKMLYIVEKMQNRGRVVACDVSAKRLGLLDENCKRLGATIVETAQHDFEGTEKNLQHRKQDDCSTDNAKAGTLHSFDRVLVDAPCSNTGVMRRRLDVRWRLKLQDLPQLAARQLELLQTAAVMVKAGGVLVYSTCSLEPEENEDVVEKFLKSKPQFRLVETRSTFPPRDGVDGAFVAKFARTK